MNKVVLAALRDRSVTENITVQQARNFDRSLRMDLADLQENELTRNLNKYFNKKIGHSRYHAFRIRDILTAWKTREDAIFGEIIICKKSFKKPMMQLQSMTLNRHLMIQRIKRIIES